MKQIRKLILIGLLVSLPAGMFAQIIRSYAIGPSLNFISSNKFTGSSINLDFQYNSQASIGNRLEFISAYNIYYGMASISYKTMDNSGGYTVSNTNSGFGYGGKILLGINYYLVPHEFSISLAPSLSYNAFLGSFDYTNPIAISNTNPIYIGDAVSSINSSINYGVNIGATYRFSQKHQVGLRFDLGLNNCTPNLDNIKTSVSTLELTYHYTLYEYSIAKKYQNKLLK